MRYELLSKRASRSSRSSTLSDPEAKQFHFFWKFLSQPAPPPPPHRHHMQQPTEKRKLLSTSRAKVCFASFCVCVCVSVCRSLIHLRKQKFALLRFLLWIDDCFVFVFLPRNRIGFVIEEARSFALHLGFEQRWLRSFALEGRKGGRRCGRPQQNKTI
jgi:hypothetical protein